MKEGIIPIYDKNTKNIDVTYRDYNSFMYEVLSGLPYESSVIKWSEVVYSNKGYYECLKVASNNTFFNRNFIIKVLKERINLEEKSLTILNENSNMN